jgi:cytochrome c oxidase subunit II
MPAVSGDTSSRAELYWAVFIIGVVVMLFGMIVFTTLHWSSMPLSRIEVIDPTTLNQSGEFIEDNLGTAVDGQGHVVVHVLAEQYAFRPRCILVPAGVPVTIRATSSDVVHGFQVLGTNINEMLVPGYVSTISTTFDEATPRTLACHEFCGVGHAAMWATVQVVPRETFEKLLRVHRRVSCV